MLRDRLADAALGVQGPSFVLEVDVALDPAGEPVLIDVGELLVDGVLDGELLAVGFDGVVETSLHA